MNATSSQMRIAIEAAEWLLRLEEDGGTAARAGFVRWLKLSARHIDEFLLVEAAWRSMHRADPQRRVDLEALIDGAREDVLPLADAMPAAVEQRSVPAAPAAARRYTRPWAYAAGLALLAAGAWFTFTQFEPVTTYRTATGEQRAFKLADGSLLHLNTRSRAEIHFTARVRDIHLLQGEALFTVKPDPARPLRVVAGPAVVQAVGTAFNVYRHADDSTRVSVVEGRVNISVPGKDATNEPFAPASAAVASLLAGEEARVQPDGRIVRQPAADLTRTLAWRQRRLVFRDTPLTEVTAQFNRYNSDPRLRLASDTMARRRITATFNADDPQALLNFLREDPTVALDSADGIVTIGIGPDRESRGRGRSGHFPP